MRYTPNVERTVSVVAAARCTVVVRCFLRRFRTRVVCCFCSPGRFGPVSLSSKDSALLTSLQDMSTLSLEGPFVARAHAQKHVALKYQPEPLHIKPRRPDRYFHDLHTRLSPSPRYRTYHLPPLSTIPLTSCNYAIVRGKLAFGRRRSRTC